MSTPDDQDTRILNRFDITQGTQRVTVLAIKGWTTAREDVAIRDALAPRSSTRDVPTTLENADPLTGYEGRTKGEWYLESSDGGYRSRVYEMGSDSHGWVAQLNQPVTDLGIKALVKAHNAVLATLVPRRTAMSVEELAAIVTDPCVYPTDEDHPEPSTFCVEHGQDGTAGLLCDGAVERVCDIAEKLGIEIASSPSTYEREAYRFDLAALAARRPTMRLEALSNIVNSPCAYDREGYRSDPQRALCDEHKSYGKPNASCDAALAHATAVAEELGVEIAEPNGPVK